MPPSVGCHIEDPFGLAFDGANIWVTQQDHGWVTKLRASDGRVLGTFGVGGRDLTAIAVDAGSVWVTDFVGNNVTKLRATDGKVLGTFGVGENPCAIAFDGVNVLGCESR